MGFFISIRVIIEIPQFNSLHICSKKRYGRFLNFADRIERSSEDNKEHNRPDPNAQEEKRMNFVCKYAYILKIIPIFAVSITY